MKKAVVTGGAGFIGSHLVDRLASDGWEEIVVFDNFRRGRRENLAAHTANRPVAVLEGDIRDEAALRQAVAGADTIFHLAAQSNVMGAVDDVDYSFETNVRGTVNVLKAARDAGVRRTVFTSSREVYGEARYTPVDEEHPLASKNTYGASKAAGELYCRVFGSNFGVETAVLRLANVYGARDFGRVIPLWMGRAARSEPLILYGGEQVIDFIHVDVVVEALLRAATADVAGTPINVGSGQGTPIIRLAQRLQGLFPTPPGIDRRPARSVEVVRFVAAVERMRTLLHLDPPADPLRQLRRLVPQPS